MEVGDSVFVYGTLRPGEGNFRWLVLHGLALNEEYKTRFFKIYAHKSTSVILSCAEIIRYGIKKVIHT